MVDLETIKILEHPLHLVLCESTYSQASSETQNIGEFSTKYKTVQLKASGLVYHHGKT